MVVLTCKPQKANSHRFAKEARRFCGQDWRKQDRGSHLRSEGRRVPSIKPYRYPSSQRRTLETDIKRLCTLHLSTASLSILWFSAHSARN